MPKIKTLFIFEILGKPPEHIKSSLEKMVEELKKQDKLEVTRSVVHEPKLVEQKEEAEAASAEKSAEVSKLVDQEMYSTFAEVEVVTEDVKLIMAIVFNMLPSHVEILEPSEFSFTNHDFSGIMSEITIRMHKYDEVTKYLMLERNELLRKLNEKDKMIGVNETVGTSSEDDAGPIGVEDTVSDEVVEEKIDKPDNSKLDNDK